MFAYMQGTIIEKTPTTVILDINGIGYFIHIPVSTFQALPRVNEILKLHIHLHVREDAQTLFGFYTKSEKNLFLKLIDISGIGPKMGLTILSGASPREFKKRILNKNVKALTLIPGIGNKTAQRMIIELEGKLSTDDDGIQTDTLLQNTKTQVTDEAVKALLSLGYKQNDANKAINKAINELGSNATLEQYIKAALNKM